MEALKRFVQNLCPDDSGPCLTDTQLISKAREELENSLFVHDSALFCHHLEQTLDIFGQMTGSVVNEQILESLFNQFCIGK
ncbi:hypothetical protein OESDEN_25064 [Oesophagostomum dentatum]|uniref:MnmE helical domain-containing protein n=1 Tax=Oesophagostomum dentatum TaxID=61180 RepID=A0A0B1RWA1_OESDE|nr:hypothetical protein OESDEN_25064 [Oesophagostomum dentatum]